MLGTILKDFLYIIYRNNFFCEQRRYEAFL